MVRLDPSLGPIAREFVLVRVTNLRGIDLALFDFDYDLVLAGLFLDAAGHAYGRFGGRSADSPDQYLTTAGLRYAAEQAMEAHRRQRYVPTADPAPLHRRIEQFSAGRRLPAATCIHCHQAYDFAREELRPQGLWQAEDAWVYPVPENLGFSVATEQGNRITAVISGSAADRCGLRRADVLHAIGAYPVASFADVQYALHRAPRQGTVPLTWERDHREMRGTIALTEGWRKTDLSWRASRKSLGPAPGVRGEDLSREEKVRLGLDPEQLAFRQGNFVSLAARQAGIRQNDIILGIAGRACRMTAGQFEVFVRMQYRPGDRVTYNILRDGRRLEVALQLPASVSN